MDTNTARGATISPCQTYRYLLWRRWADGPACNFVMLNPSTADAEREDATIRRCLAFAHHWKYPALMVTNLFAYRATDPKAMFSAAADQVDIIGPDNDATLLQTAQAAGIVLCAWGTRDIYRADYVRWLLRGAGVPLHYLRLTQMGFPEHPLRLPAKFKPLQWSDAVYAQSYTGSRCAREAA